MFIFNISSWRKLCLVLLLVRGFWVMDTPPEVVPEDQISLYWYLQETVTAVGWSTQELNILCALITTESGWNPKAYNDTVVKVYGLGQLTQWWLKSPALSEYRLSENWESRDLYNGEDNILTMVELLKYYEVRCDGDWEAMLSCYSSGQELKTSTYAKLVLDRAKDSKYQLLREVVCFYAGGYT